MNLKKPLIIGAVVALAGAAMMGVTYKSANFNLSFEKDSGLKTVDIRQNQQVFDQKDINKLNLDVKDQQVAVQQGDSNKWTVKTTAYDGKQSSVNVQKGTLNVIENDHTQDHLVMTLGNSGGIQISSNPAWNENDTVITTPKDVKLSDIKVNGKNGGIILKKVSAKQTHINLNKGGARLIDFKGDVLKSDITNGRMHLKNVNVNQLQVKGDQLDIAGSGLKTHQASRVMGNSGSFRVDRVKAPGFNLKTDDEISFNKATGDDKSGVYIKKAKNKLKRGDQAQALFVGKGDLKIAINESKGLPDDDDYDDYDD